MHLVLLYLMAACTVNTHSAAQTKHSTIDRLFFLLTSPPSVSTCEIVDITLSLSKPIIR